MFRAENKHEKNRSGFSEAIEANPLDLNGRRSLSSRLEFLSLIMVDLTTQRNFEDKVTKLEKQLNLWRQRDLDSNRKDNKDENTGSRKASILCFGPASTKKT